MSRMSPPPLLLGLTLLFWGWQTGFLFVAIAMAAVVESSHLIRVRWQFSPTDYNRISDLCFILVAGGAVYAFASNDGAGAITGFFDNPARRVDAFSKSGRSALALAQWLPMLLFPLMAAQAFSAHRRTEFSALSLILRWRQTRRRARDASGPPGYTIDLAFPYFALCLFSSSAAKGTPAWFYAGISLLLGWALWTQKPKRISVIPWAGLLILIVGLGSAGIFGIRELQRLAERLDTSWLIRLGAQAFNPKESRTSLGSVGQMKLSGRIVLRVDAKGQPPPPLLREASYSLFKSPLWSAPNKEFQALNPEADETLWKLLPKKSSKKSVIISRYLEDGAGLLALPNGSSQLQDLPVFLLSSNVYGVLKVGAGPGLVSYLAQYDEGETIDSPPTDEDLIVPPAEDRTLSQIARELDLASRGTNEIVRTVASFLQNKFHYSSWVGSAQKPFPHQTALAAFLLQNRSGHCEYFATATTLLLRKAGIPARYAVGYSVQEGAGGKYVVRERHGHAWCLVYLEGAWRDLDTTPGSWNAVEAGHASFWEPISDAWSRLWFEFSKWRWSQSGFRKYVLWLALPLLLLAAGRLFFKKQWRRFAQDWRKSSRQAVPGLDSEFYLIEKELLELGLGRQAGETLAAWIGRIRAPGAPRLEPLPGILDLHYRYRFDPAGLAEPERADLADRVRRWLEGTPA